jgi:hypothetical protein
MRGEKRPQAGSEPWATGAGCADTAVAGLCISTSILAVVYARFNGGVATALRQSRDALSCNIERLQPQLSRSRSRMNGAASN